MSDLQARIGQEIFPNARWVRPGYSPPVRNRSLGKRQRSLEYDNENLNNVEDSPPDNRASHRRSSLLTRMGITEDEVADSDMNDVSKTLLQRMSVSMSPAPDERGVSLFERVEPITADEEERNAQSLDHLCFTLHNTPATDSSLSISSRDKGRWDAPTIDTNNDENRELHCQIAEKTQNGDASQHQTKELEPKNLGRYPTPQNQDVSTSRSGNLPGVPLLSSTPSQSSSVEEGQVSEKGTENSSFSEGEIRVGVLPPAKVRDLILPLVVQNAAKRFRDTESQPSLQSPVVNTNVLSDKLLTTFVAKATEQTSRDLRNRVQLPSKPVSIVESDNKSISLGASRLPSKPVPSNGVPQIESNRRLSSSSKSSSNVVQARVLSPIRSPSEDMVARPMAPAHAYTYRQEKGTPLRYTPEPSESQANQYEQTSAQPRPASQHVSITQPSSTALKDPSESQLRDYVERSTAATNNSHPITSHRPPTSPTRERRESRWDHKEIENSREREHHLVWEREKDPERDREDARRRISDAHSPQRSPTQRMPPHSPSSMRIPRGPVAHDQRRQSGSWAGAPSGSGSTPSNSRGPVSPVQAVRHPQHENNRPPQYEHASRYPGRYTRPDRLSPPPAEGYTTYDPGNSKRSYSPRQKSTERPPSHSPNSSFQKERERRRSKSRSRSQQRSGERDRGKEREWKTKEQEQPARPAELSPKATREGRKDSVLGARHIPENGSIQRSISQDGKAENIPRPVYFTQPGANRIGVIKWYFDIDSETAKNMRLGPRSGSGPIGHDFSLPAKQKTVLKLACFPAEGFLKCINVLKSGQTLTANTSPLNPQWPTQGHLIIKVNQDMPHTRGKTYFPDKLSPDDIPISIEQYIYEGKNCIELVQLSNMLDRVFLLFSQTIPIPPPMPEVNPVKLPPFDTAPGPINITRAIVTSGRL